MRIKNRIGIIDMGTNTFHLLVAEEGFAPFNVLHNEKKDVRFGYNGISSGEITREAMDRAIETMLSFKKSCKRFNVVPQAFATSALRNAHNSEHIKEELMLATGIPIHVVSGENEAEYIYLGVKSSMEMGDTTHLILDIGGGSVEFILGDGENILWKKSFEVGVQRLKDKFHHHDPILASEQVQIIDYLDETLNPLLLVLDIYQPQNLIGCSGTFDTLSDIYESRHALGTPEFSSTGFFELSYFEQLHEELVTRTFNERLQVHHMSPLRAEMIVVAVTLLKWLLDKYTFTSMKVSHFAMKEGILYKTLNRN